jgi:hypothetical protein
MWLPPRNIESIEKESTRKSINVNSEISLVRMSTFMDVVLLIFWGGLKLLNNLSDNKAPDCANIFDYLCL